MPIGVLIAVGYSFIIGYPLFRLKGHYFAIATICTSLVLQDIFINWKLVGGAKGIELPIHEHPDFLYMQFKKDTYYFYFIMALFYAGIFYMNWFRKSKLGYQLRMIKEDEEAAESLGIDARWCKIKAYSIASAFVAVGGGFLAVYNLYIDPYSVMDLDLSIKIALMAMLGGAGSMWGPIIGAAFLVPLDRFRSLKLSPDAICAIPSSEYPTAAERPANSRLDTGKLRRTFGLELPNWQSGVRHILQQILADGKLEVASCKSQAASRK